MINRLIFVVRTLRVPFILMLVVTLSGCATQPTKALRSQVDQMAQFRKRVFVLDFDDDGHLANPAELGTAMAEISETLKHPRPGSQAVRKILVISYGWANNRDDALDTYYGEAMKYLQAEKLLPLKTDSDGTVDFGDWAVLCVSWNSSTSAIGTALKDIIPGDSISDIIATTPSYALFPFTFWSKARLADDIGYGSLNEALTLLIEDTYEQNRFQTPELFLVGHSFGCRILSALTKETLGGIRLAKVHPAGVTKSGDAASYAVPFKYIQNIRGAVFYQPALSELNLPQSEGQTYHFPVVVTESRHDHANGFLYPVGNVLLNSYTFTGTAAIFDRMFPESNNVLAQSGRDVVVLGGSLVWTVAALPVSYVWAQGNLIADRKLNHIGDTLAHLPLVDIPVDALDSALPDKLQPHWGEYNLGFLDLGSGFESAGHMRSVIIGSGVTHPIDPDTALLAVKAGANGCIYVDESSKISHSIISADINYAKPVPEHTVGWIDPVGAHVDYDPAFDLLKAVLELGTK